MGSGCSCSARDATVDSDYTDDETGEYVSPATSMGDVTSEERTPDEKKSSSRRSSDKGKRRCSRRISASNGSTTNPEETITSEDEETSHTAPHHSRSRTTSTSHSRSSTTSSTAPQEQPVPLNIPPVIPDMVVHYEERRSVSIGGVSTHSGGADHRDQRENSDSRSQGASLTVAIDQLGRRPVSPRGGTSPSSGFGKVVVATKKQRRNQQLTILAPTTPASVDNDEEHPDDFDLASEAGEAGSTLLRTPRGTNSLGFDGPDVEYSLDDDFEDDCLSEVCDFVGYVKRKESSNSASQSLRLPPPACRSCHKPSPVQSAKFCCFCGMPYPSQEDSTKGSDNFEDEVRSMSVCSASNGSPNQKYRVNTRRVRISRRAENILGKGTSGVVYRCFDFSSGAPLAVKEIKANLDDKNEVRKMKQELRHLSRLRHPFVIKYFGCNVQRGGANPKVSILTERLECGTLQQMIDGFSGGIPETVVRRFTKELVQAIAYCHSNGVTHRDVKPANLLLTSDGDIKLTDFGSAFDDVKQNSRELEVAGTAAYMPPEVLEVSKNKHRSSEYFRAHDVWSIGCTVHQLLTGVVPWAHTNLTPFALVMHIANVRKFPITAVVSPEMNDFLELCLEPEMEDRPTAEDLLEHVVLASDAFETDSQTSEHLSTSLSSATTTSRNHSVPHVLATSGVAAQSGHSLSDSTPLESGAHSQREIAANPLRPPPPTDEETTIDLTSLSPSAAPGPANWKDGGAATAGPTTPQGLASPQKPPLSPGMNAMAKPHNPRIDVPSFTTHTNNPDTAHWSEEE